MVKPFARSLLADRLASDKWRLLFLSDQQNTTLPSAELEQESQSRSMSISELFHFWKMSTQLGLEAELAPPLKLAPPIVRLPTLMRSQFVPHFSRGQCLPRSRTIAESDIRLVLQRNDKDESRKYDSSHFTVSVAQLKHCIARNGRTVGQLGKTVDEEDWSVEEKERDIAYQRRRVRLFRELLQDCNKNRAQMVKEARVDIPPSLRASIWAAVLGAPPPAECKRIYDSIDKESDGPADRQIELDIPRCHQYHELLSSPLGHRKFKAVLKAWVANNPGLSYWQGIDSLLAPFLTLNFDDESVAFVCLQATIEKYSKNLFTKDNTMFLQEHLQTFKQLLFYHDPELALHLHHIGFQPDLYAIPWFLTLFTHDFTIDQIYRLWDRVLVGDSRAPFFLAYAVMKQLREILLPLDFNACILLFSSLPSISTDSFLKDADYAAVHTPPSITMPNYALHAPSSRWWESRVPLEEFQRDLSPRITVADLVSSSFKFSVLDIREPQAFSALHFPGASNIDVATSDISSLVNQTEGTHVVVVGDQMEAGSNVSNGARSYVHIACY